eukprot:5401284-Pyramimonas_sp.AAC.1
MRQLDRRTRRPRVRRYHREAGCARYRRRYVGHLLDQRRDERVRPDCAEGLVGEVSLEQQCEED